jgi:hypothetical protein
VTSKRAERRHRRASERADQARLAAPAMLRAEHDLREQVSAMGRRVAAMHRHAQLDAQLKKLGEEVQAVGEEWKTIYKGVTAGVMTVEALRLVGRQVADAQLADLLAAQAQLETASARWSALVERHKAILNERTDLGVVPVNQQEMAANREKIDNVMTAVAEAVKRCRADVDRLFKDGIDA